MKTWENIKNINKPEQYHFEIVKWQHINKFKDYWINILHDKIYKVYTISFFGTPINKHFESYYSCHRLIYQIAVEYMQYWKFHIEDFLKSKDLV